jgi:hypothetical protein
MQASSRFSVTTSVWETTSPLLPLRISCCCYRCFCSCCSRCQSSVERFTVEWPAAWGLFRTCRQRWFLQPRAVDPLAATTAAESATLTSAITCFRRQGRIGPSPCSMWFVFPPRSRHETEPIGHGASKHLLVLQEGVSRSFRTRRLGEHLRRLHARRSCGSCCCCCLIIRRRNATPFFSRRRRATKRPTAGT